MIVNMTSYREIATSMGVDVVSILFKLTLKRTLTVTSIYHVPGTPMK